MIHTVYSYNNTYIDSVGLSVYFFNSVALSVRFFAGGQCYVSQNWWIWTWQDPPSSRHMPSSPPHSFVDKQSQQSKANPKQSDRCVSTINEPSDVSDSRHQQRTAATQHPSCHHHDTARPHQHQKQPRDKPTTYITRPGDNDCHTTPVPPHAT